MYPIPVVAPIALILSIIKIFLLKINKEEVKQIDEYPLIHLMILVVMNDWITGMDYINNIPYKLTKVTLAILIIITAVALIKVIIQNFVLLVKEKKKKLWWFINLLIIGLLVAFTGIVIVLTVGIMYIYAYIMLVVNIFVILKFTIKHLKEVF